MKQCLLVFFFCFLGTFAFSQTWVDGYYKADGTFVQGHYRTKTNSTNIDNYSTKGNQNPFTGSNGYKAADYSNDSYNNSSGKIIYTGPKGGRYYINSNGKKVYVPKGN